MSEKCTEATLCFLIREEEVLLAEKQRKIGAGFLNGFGGKIEIGDKSIYDTNFREVKEEIDVSIKIARKMGEILFNNPSDDNSLKNIRVHVFVATEWEGEPKETDEMKGVSWHNITDLDYNKFLAADRLFIPQILKGECIKGAIDYNDDWSVKSSSIGTVEGFEA